MPSGLVIRTTSRSIVRRLAPWAVVLFVGGLLIGVLPSVQAQTGTSASDAFPVGADGKFDLRPVTIAEQVGTMSIVEQGINAGDKVVVSDVVRLRPGMPVHAVPATDKSTASAAPSPWTSSPKPNARSGRNCGRKLNR